MKKLIIVLILLPLFLKAQIGEQELLFEINKDETDVFAEIYVLGDINNDGFDDFIFQSYSNNQHDLKCLFGNSSDDFFDDEPVVLIEDHFVSFLTKLELKDFDLDGDLELFVLKYDHIALIHFNSDGTVSNTEEINVLGQDNTFQSYVLDDIDNDGDYDFVFIYEDLGFDYNLSETYISVRENIFGSQIYHEISSVFYVWDDYSFYIPVLKTHDLDGDGLKDIYFQFHSHQPLFYGSDIDEFITLNNLGNFQFEPFDFLNPSGLLTSPSFNYNELDHRVLDLNLDGTQDLISLRSGIAYDVLNSSEYDNNLNNQNNGTFLGRPDFKTGQVIADLNGDGFSEIISNSDDYLYYHLNETGIFNAPIIIDQSTEALDEAVIECKDFDNDNDIDILLFWDLHTMHFYENENLTFEKRTIRRPASYDIQSLAYEDLNNDNIKDISLINDNEETIILELNQQTEIVDTTFLAPFNIKPIKHFSFDLNDDSFMDFLFINSTGLYSSLNDGQANFSQVDTLQQLTFPVLEDNLYFFDLDGDGDQDIVGLNKSSELSEKGVFWLQNNGSEFLTLEVIKSHNWILDLNIADLNNDNLLDLSYLTSDTLFALFNNGNLSFETSYKVTNNAQWRHLSTGDYNNDGYTDIYISGLSQLGLGLVLNEQGTNISNDIVSLITNENFANFQSDHFIEDVDNDGDQDIIFNHGRSLFYQINPFLYSEKYEFHSQFGFDTDIQFTDFNNDDFVDFLFNTSHSIVKTINSGNTIKSVSGNLFLDENINGIKDEGEEGFPYSQVYFNADDLSITANGEGQYVRSFFEFGEQQIEPLYNETLWNLTSVQNYDTLLSLGNENIDSLDFGFSPNGEIDSLELSLNFNTTQCGFEGFANICVKNEGNTVVDGLVSLYIDTPLFYTGISNTDSIVGNTAYFSFESLNIQELNCFSIPFQNPGVDWIDSLLTFSASIEQLNGTFSDSLLRTEIVTCAYDPNDKTEHTGWTENGFVLGSVPLEYTIRFQNTGTDTAITVVLQDPLSPLLNKNTLNPIAWSHDFEMIIDDNDKAIFTFAEIFLPDSNVNESESHGFITFTIDAQEGLDPGTLIENTAYIYFDFNPAIVTNTEINTIFSCDSLSNFVVQNELCTNNIFEASSLENYIENYTWSVNGISIGNESNLLHEFENPGDYWLKFSAENPLCQISDSALISVIETPLSFAGIDTSFCGVEGSIMASENGFGGMWSSTGDILIDSENDYASLITASGQGAYEIIWTSFNGMCQSNDTVNVTFYEIPWVEIDEIDGVLYANTFGDSYQWYFNGDSISGANGGSFTPTENGEYTVSVEGQNDCLGFSEVFNFIIDGIFEIENLTLQISPNPSNEIFWVQIQTNSIIEFEIEILDQNGRNVRRESIKQKRTKMARGELASGIYILNLRANEKILRSEKLILD